MTDSEVNEIMELAKFRSFKVECVYGDGEIDKDDVVSITELGRILWTIQHGKEK